MKKFLSLLIVHYKESEKTIKRCLDSIAIQQNVDFGEIEVIIGNDGDECILDKSVYEYYPFEVKYEIFEKRGISACRNRLLSLAEGEYIQWIDGDDCFFNIAALWMDMREIKEGGGFDALVQNFVCEVKRPDNGKIDYQEMQMNGQQFVHGKVYRKKFLTDNEICFRENYPDRDVHEDHVIMALTRSLSQNVKYNPTAGFLWANNEDSVSRKDPYYLQHTTKYLLMNNSWVLEKLYKKGKLQELRTTAYSMFVDIYYSLCEDKWLETSTKADRDECEGYFKFYYERYNKYVEELDTETKKQIEISQKNLHTMQGLSFENQTWKQWWEHLKDVAPIEFEIKCKN